MLARQELQVQKKREQETREESTVPLRTFVPNADIYENEDALTVILEMPGVEKGNVDVRVENDVLRVEGRLDLSKYQGLQPLHVEYNIGHYARSFQLSSKIDQGKIEASLRDGVLSLTLPKVAAARPRKISIS
jgi:HSP20 family molecular chaperone IbpA